MAPGSQMYASLLVAYVVAYVLGMGALFFFDENRATKKDFRHICF